MKRLVFVLLTVLIANLGFTQTKRTVSGNNISKIASVLSDTVYNAIYTFTGNGNWSDTTNWLNNSVPPDTLSSGAEIIIDSNSTCNLNIPQTISFGATLTVSFGANLIVIGHFLDYN